MNTVFPIIQPAREAYIILAIISILLVAITIFFIGATISVNNTKCIFEDNRIKINSFQYGTSVNYAEIAISNVKLINIKSEPEYDLKIRSNGIGLPGLKTGWFKLNNGERALAFITNPEKVIYIPTSRNYSVLLSIEDGNGFIEELKNKIKR
jgi:hypothetical protein